MTTRIRTSNEFCPQNLIRCCKSLFVASTLEEFDIYPRALNINKFLYRNELESDVACAVLNLLLSSNKLHHNIGVD